MYWANTETAVDTKEQALPPQQGDQTGLSNPFLNHLECIETPEASRHLLEGALDVGEFEAAIQVGSPGFTKVPIFTSANFQ